MCALNLQQCQDALEDRLKDGAASQKLHATVNERLLPVGCCDLQPTNDVADFQLCERRGNERQRHVCILDRTCTLTSIITDTLLCALPQAQYNAKHEPDTYDCCIHTLTETYLLHSFRILSTLSAVRDSEWRSYISDIISAISAGELSCSVMVLQDAMSLMRDLQQPQATYFTMGSTSPGRQQFCAG